jgi:CRP-like cAMP-binding protein
MLEKNAQIFKNVILSALAPADVTLLMSALTLVSLDVGQVLEFPHVDIENVYFLEGGVISVNGVTKSGLSMQIAIIGREGATGTALVLGNKSWAHTSVVQVPTPAWRLSVEDFYWLLSKSFRLRNVMLRYTGTLAGQIASTALANGRSTVRERLARWILQMQDRLDGNGLNVTHDAIADALGVRRPGITVALHILEGNHLVRSNRGRLVVIDREGLILASGGCYREGD